jgi:hypothetical protein
MDHLAVMAVVVQVLMYTARVMAELQVTVILGVVPQMA